MPEPSTSPAPDEFALAATAALAAIEEHLFPLWTINQKQEYETDVKDMIVFSKGTIQFRGHRLFRYMTSNRTSVPISAFQIIWGREALSRVTWFSGWLESNADFSKFPTDAMIRLPKAPKSPQKRKADNATADPPAKKKTPETPNPATKNSAWKPVNKGQADRALPKPSAEQEKKDGDAELSQSRGITQRDANNKPETDQEQTRALAHALKNKERAYQKCLEQLMQLQKKQKEYEKQKNQLLVAIIAKERDCELRLQAEKDKAQAQGESSGACGTDCADEKAKLQAAVEKEVARHKELKKTFRDKYDTLCEGRDAGMQQYCESKDLEQKKYRDELEAEYQAFCTEKEKEYSQHIESANLESQKRYDELYAKYKELSESVARGEKSQPDSREQTPMAEHDCVAACARKDRQYKAFCERKAREVKTYRNRLEREYRELYEKKERDFEALCEKKEQEYMELCENLEEVRAMEDCME